MPQPLVLVDAAVRTPPDRPFWTTPDMWEPERWWPTWTNAYAAQTFFGFSKHTLIRHLKEGNHVSANTGEVSPPRRSGGVEPYAWRLYDIELMAHALLANGKISAGTASRAILMVKTCAELHHYL